MSNKEISRHVLTPDLLILEMIGPKTESHLGPGPKIICIQASDLLWARGLFSFGPWDRSHLGPGSILIWAWGQISFGPEARTHLGPGPDLNWARGPISDESRVRITRGPGPIVFGSTQGHNFSKCLDGIHHCNCRLQAHHTCLTSLDMKISDIPTDIPFRRYIPVF